MPTKTSTVTDASKRPLAIAGHDVHYTALPDRAWRVSDTHGRVWGHIRSEESLLGERYVARRFHAATLTFREIGSFWKMSEAVESLKTG